MKLKNIIPVVVCLFLAVAASAQERIFKKNGEIIEAKLSLINSDIIVFKRYDNPNGPEYTIPKGEVAKIVYSNGMQDIFEENNDRIGIAKGRESFRPYNESSRNKNIVGIAPLQFTDHGYGVGVNWEHNLDRVGWVSINIPAIITWNFTQSAQVRRDPMFYLEPGVKVYTNLNGPQRSKFSIGPSLLVGLGTGTPTATNYDPYGNPIDQAPHQSHVQLGALINAGANLFPTNHVYLGFDIGMGVSYLNKYNNIDYPAAFLFEMSFKMGYRYEHKVKK